MLDIYRSRCCTTTPGDASHHRQAAHIMCKLENVLRTTSTSSTNERTDDLKPTRNCMITTKRPKHMFEQRPQMTQWRQSMAWQNKTKKPSTCWSPNMFTASCHKSRLCRTERLSPRRNSARRCPAISRRHTSATTRRLQGRTVSGLAYHDNTGFT